MNNRFFNKSRRTYRLEGTDGERMTVMPLAFATIPDKFHGDITFRLAVSSGELEQIVSNKQADNVEKKSHENPNAGDHSEGKDKKPAATTNGKKKPGTPDGDA